MLANIVFYGLVWCLTSGIATLIFSLTILRRAPGPSGDLAAELDCEADEQGRRVFYPGGKQSAIFDR